MDFLQGTLFKNTYQEWFTAAVIFLAFVTVLPFIKLIFVKQITRISDKREGVVYDFLLEIFRNLKFYLFVVLGLYSAVYVLELPAKILNIINIIVVLTFVLQCIVWGNKIIDLGLNRYKTKRLESDPASITTMAALGFVAKLLLYVLLFLFALSNLGVDVTGLVAGLGIGGIAVALAVQNVLGDLFASLSIVLDKPFVIDDFIIVGDYLGSVKKIGLKTTRIQSLSGEQIIFSNSDLLNSRIRNYKRMYERRIVFKIGVTYQTPHEKLQAIQKMLRDIVEAQEMARFDRAHFSEYGNFSLNFEIVYYVKSPDYNTYMDTQQAINLAIFKKFEQEDITFAYPTQTVYLNSEDNGSLKVSDELTHQNVRSENNS